MANKAASAKIDAPNNFRDSKDGLIACVGLAEEGFKLDEGSADKPKREIVITLLREGPGNSRDKRIYLRECVNGLEPLLYTRRKLFFNHIKEGAPAASDDIKDWAATLVNTWTVEGADGMIECKGRIKIHDNWLWERCQDPIARREIAVSIEGRGAGRIEKRDGADYTLIEKIYWLNAFKFVPYPGNATMGADTVEAAAAPAVKPEEDLNMDPKLITLELLEADRPDLVEAIAKKVSNKLAEAAAPKAAALDALRVELTEKFEGRIKALTGTIKTLESKLDDADRRVDASEVREKMAHKERVIAAVLAEAGLPPEAKTDRFLARLRAVVEREVPGENGTKKVSTVEDQIQAEVAEQKKLVTPILGQQNGKKSEGQAAGENTDYGNLSEEDKQWIFDKEFMGLHEGETFADYRKAKKGEGKDADGGKDKK